MATYILTPSQLNNRILNSFVIPAGSSFDPDAQAFITAAGITNATQQTAIDNLVIGLKADGIWTPMRAIYPFVGGTATTHKYNLKDPRDLDAAYRLAFGGGITHSSTGALPNGTNGYADTFFQPSNLPNNSIHFSAYYRADGNGGGARQWGCSYIIGDNEGVMYGQHYFQPQSTNGMKYVNGGGVSGASSTVFTTNNRGNYLTTRTDLTNTQLYQNNTLISSQNLGSNNAIARMYLMAWNLNWSDFGDGAFVEYSNKAISFATIGEGLDNTQSVNLYNRIQTFQTSLSRQV
jgi:hypothetical protein